MAPLHVRMEESSSLVVGLVSLQLSHSKLVEGAIIDRCCTSCLGESGDGSDVYQALYFPDFEVEHLI